jgi:signal transduction histidine kinase
LRGRERNANRVLSLSELVLLDCQFGSPKRHGRLFTLQDEERRRLALDLHDSTSQCLAALTIEDQGRGRRDQVPHQSGALLSETLGVGIQGMRERIRQLGGTFDIVFTDAGTTVRVRVPLREVVV